MKKLILAVAIFLSVINLLSAEKPAFDGVVSVNKKKVDSISSLIVDKIHKEVNLTENQKSKLLSRAKQFYQKMEETKAENYNPNNHKARREAFESFKGSVDSILTTTQRKTLEDKNAERRKAFEAKKEDKKNNK